MRGWLGMVACLIALVRTWPAIGVDECDVPVGHLVSIQGTVQIRHALSGAWKGARLNEPLCDSTDIQVADRSRAEVALIDRSQLRIDQNSTLRLVKIREKEPSLISFLEGVVYFFSRQPRVLNIDTPFVTAAIEGTEFLVSVDAGQALLTVFEGTIAASNDQGRLLLASGDSAVARAGEAPERYVLVRPRDAVQWALYYPFILLPLADASGLAAQAIAEPLGGAVALAARGEFVAAFRRFESIPDAERGAEFHVYRAGALLAVGRIAEARADIDQALSRDPQNGPAYGIRAVIAVAQNEPVQALEDARRAIDLSPRSAAAKIALSYAEQAQFRIRAAKDVLEEAVEDEPNNALAWARLSEVWLMLGYRRRALRAAKKAEELAPELERVATVLGFAALAAIDTSRAKAAFERAIRIDSANPQPRLGLGLAKIRESDLEEGRRDIEIAVALDPNRSLLRSYLGKAYFEEKRETLAGEQYAIAKELDPLDPTPWFYDAILKQTENRPVEALRELEKSIELNDNRAVYRSRELLDEDRAARQASLARIYNDLGFEQLGINEATKSLSYDPANAAAHRFLSDVYATRPRVEISRVSELLQAQLLQDININPVQPSLSVINPTIITRGGPTAVGFNEYNTLFERNRAQLNLSGVVGSDWTRGEEAVISGVYDRFSLSAGQYHFQSNGFRENFNFRDDIADLFAQAAITPELNIQAEFRKRHIEQGDLQFAFDPQFFSSDFQRDLDQLSGRFGLRYSLSPNSDFIGSFIYSKRHEKFQLPSSGLDDRLHQDGVQSEGQHIFHTNTFNIVSGASHYDIDVKRDRISLGRPTFDELYRTANQSNVYTYWNFVFPKDFSWTVGLSYDDYDDQNSDIKALNPKLGLRWDIAPGLHLRLAAFKAVQPVLIAHQTIQPTQVAGFNQFFDDIIGTETWRYGVGLDAHPRDTVYVGGEVSWRELDNLTPSRLGKEFTGDRDEKLYRGYLYWTPANRWALLSEVLFDDIDAEKLSPVGRVTTFTVPLAVQYFDPSGIFAGIGSSYVHQDVDATSPGIPEGSNSFFLLNAQLGYRLPHRYGLISLEGKNLLNKGFNFEDDQFRALPDVQPVSPFIPERTILARVILTF